MVITGFSSHGVFIQNLANNTIGGTGAGEGNVITNNGSIGILINQAGSHHNGVQGNFIGTDGFSALGNGDDGVNISGGSDNTTGVLDCRVPGRRHPPSDMPPRFATDGAHSPLGPE